MDVNGTNGSTESEQNVRNVKILREVIRKITVDCKAIKVRVWKKCKASRVLKAERGVGK